jgi:hypothetical protein
VLSRAGYAVLTGRGWVFCRVVAKSFACLWARYDGVSAGWTAEQCGVLDIMGTGWVREHLHLIFYT